MASLTTTIAITSGKAVANLLFGTGLNAADKNASLAKLGELLERIAGGFETATVEVRVGGTADVRASATATCASVVATDTLVVGKTTFTAIANGGTPTSIQFAVGTGGTANADTAKAIAAAINANTTTNKIVTATAAAAVVTVKAISPGLLGNHVAFSSTGGTITCTGSGYLASGAGRDSTPTSFTFP